MIRIGSLFVLLLGISLFSEARSVKNEIVANQNQEKINSRYCIVVGSFSSLSNAEKFGNSLKSKGYEAAYRKNETGFYRVCLFDFNTELEAKQKIMELKPKDALFKQVWVLAYKDSSEKITPKVQTATKPVAEKAKSKPVQTQKTTTPPVSTSTVKKQTPVTEKVKSDPVQAKKSTTPPASVPTSTVKKQEPPIAEKVNKPVPQDAKTYARYCLVINRHSTVDAAKEYGLSLQSNGYSVFMRTEQDGSYLVCMYNMDTMPDAEKRLDKMRHIDGIFTNAWILGYDDLAGNISVNQP